MTKAERQRRIRRLRSGRIPLDAPPTPRGADRRGENNPLRKLTWEKVREARRLREEDPTIWTVQKLADWYGVGLTTMRELLAGNTWRE